VALVVPQSASQPSIVAHVNVMPTGPSRTQRTMTITVTSRRELMSASSITGETAVVKNSESRYSAARRRRSALAMTDTELKLIAALAMIGLSRRPNQG
jgi:hypothetical protein